MRNVDNKHFEILLKSYQVMVKTLQIRIEMVDSSSPNNGYLKEVLTDKLNQYNKRISELEKSLDEVKL